MKNTEIKTLSQPQELEAQLLALVSGGQSATARDYTVYATAAQAVLPPLQAPATAG